MPVFALNENEISFPLPQLAEDDGLLAVGGDLSRERLVLAYSNGIFPWYNEGQPIMWWCPRERYIIRPGNVHISHSMKKFMRKHDIRVEVNRDFSDTMHRCRIKREFAEGTWITTDMENAYADLAANNLAGAAIDVFPTEPATNSDPFTSPLCEFDNVLLTPHIGGSTQEAQENIGLEVAGKLIKYSDNGSTLSAVNFPEVSLPLHGGRRLMHIHENRPGVLTALNKIFAEQGVNIAAQYLQTSAQMGYVVIDIEADEDVAEKALQAMKAIPGTIRARLLY